MKQLFYLSLLIVLWTCYDVFAFSQPAASMQCTFSHHPDISGMEVGHLGGRQIYTLFTRSLLYERDAIYEAFQNSSSAEDFVERLDDIIEDEDNQELITSEQSEVQKIVDLLRLERLDWVGLETSPERLVNNPIDGRIKAYSDNQNFLNTNLSFLDGWNSNKTEQVLALIYNPYIIALANNRDLFNGVEMIALDDEDLREVENQYYDSVRDYGNFLREHYHVYASVNRSVVERFFGFVQSIISRPELIIISQNELEDLLDELGVEESARIYMRRILDSINNATDISRQRDQKAVASILNQPGNGLVLFGTAHGPGIKQGLTTACENNL